METRKDTLKISNKGNTGNTGNIEKNEILSALELGQLERDRKIYNWTPEELQSAKSKREQDKTTYSEQEKELDKRAKELGYKNYKEQKDKQFVNKFMNKNTNNTEKTQRTQKTVVAHPFVKKVEAVEFNEVNIPGDIKIDESGKLLKEYFQYEGRIGSLIDQYNKFITFGLTEHISSRHLVMPNGIVTFENLIINRPVIKKLNGRNVPLFPQEARNSGYSYTADMYIDMVLNKGQTEERVPKIFLGKIPVMLGSQLDWISTKSESERIELGESIHDPLGYFIIKGTEKIILIQEKLRANRIFVFNSSNKGKVVCKVTNNTIFGSTQITMTQGKKSGAVKLHLGFLGDTGSAKSNKIGRTVTLFQIYRLLGVEKTSDMLDLIYLFVKPAYRKKVYVLLQPTLVKLSKIADDIDYISKKKNLGNTEYIIRKTDIMNDLYKQLFPQISTESNTHVTERLYMLSMMASRFLEYLAGARGLDDRDNWGNKQLVSAGKSLELLFSSIWKTVILAAQKEIEDKKLNGLNAAKHSINTSFITDNFIESFTQGNWGVKSSYLTKENITDILKRDSILSVYSHLTRVNTPGSKKAASTKVRMVQMSQLGYIDAAETPEGEMCLAAGTKILMANGKYKPIEKIIEGDIVFTVNTQTFTRVASVVTSPFSFHSEDGNKNMYEININTVDGVKKIRATNDHPFFTQFGWLQADKLHMNHDEILYFCENIKDFIFCQIILIEKIEAEMVYDFTTVSENHSFIAEGMVTHNCGLTKNTAMTTYMSLDRPENAILELIGNYVYNTPAEEHINPFILNGIFKGWVNGNSLREVCLRFRRNLTFPKDVAIVLEGDGFFNIYTDSCRPTRPLLVLEDGELVIETKNLWNANFDELIRSGCVEYIDSWEQENIMLAQSIYDLRQRKFNIETARRNLQTAESNSDNLVISESRNILNELLDFPAYTHCELDPTAIMSIAVGVIPLAETNPGPRLTYQAGMGKQALGIYHSNHGARFDKTSKLLAYPSRPMFETQMNAILGLDDLPAGETVIVAITTYTGFAQEDAIVMAKGAIERGLFRSIIYKTYKNLRKKTKLTREEFARPEIKKGEEEKYLAIDEKGLPIVGSAVREGDCIIGKIRKNIESGKIENASTFVETHQEGVIDRVLVSTNPEGDRIVKVKIRQVRQPVIGDKFACYTPDHEILTKNRGWVLFSDLKLTDLVASWTDTGISFVHPSAIQKYPYDGKIYHVENQWVSLAVTPNHRMYVRKEKAYVVLPVSEISQSVYYTDGDNEFLVTPEQVRTREYSGNVYCCSVDSGIIFVRRNNKAVLCGNSRYAQKGTIGLIVPDEDMPFTSNGMRPDIIINPLSIPSRMTIGKMIEIVTSKLAAFTGERVNATSFRRFDVKEFAQNLKEYGYTSSGSEKMNSGLTGRPIEALIFTGPCYYQALRHQVDDKIQMRARGGVSQLTRQPVSGRKRGGGLRVGEMERDAAISHGAASFLQERLCLVSDKYETVYCSTCGSIAISNIMEQKYVCRNCDERAEFGKCTIPTSYKLLSQLLLAAGINTKFKMQPQAK